MSIIGKFGPFVPGEEVRVWGRVVHFGVIEGKLFVWSECSQERHPTLMTFTLLFLPGLNWGTDAT